jgi:hypothetical protein
MIGWRALLAGLSLASIARGELYFLDYSEHPEISEGIEISWSGDAPPVRYLRVLYSGFRLYSSV